MLGGLILLGFRIGRRKRAIGCFVEGLRAFGCAVRSIYRLFLAVVFRVMAIMLEISCLVSVIAVCEGLQFACLFYLPCILVHTA